MLQVYIRIASMRQFQCVDIASMRQFQCICLFNNEFFCLKKLMVKNSLLKRHIHWNCLIEAMSTHWNCLIEAILIYTCNICYWKQGRKLFENLHFPSIMGKGIMTTVPAWCVSAHASFVFKIDSQKTQCLLIALNKMQLLKKIILYVEVIFKDAWNEDGCLYGGLM